MQRYLAFLALLMAVLMVGACASQEHHPYPAEPQAAEPAPAPVEAEAAPAASCWPMLTLMGGHSTKVDMVRAEFIAQGWDPQQIKTVAEGSKSKVKAVVEGYGFIDVPTSNRVLVRGLCSTQIAAIHGLTSCHLCGPCGKCGPCKE